jgi:succinate-semialdehyde dehydrogenase/glutarate-semialdehyde dehydrogenase
MPSPTRPPANSVRSYPTATDTRSGRGCNRRRRRLQGGTKRLDDRVQLLGRVAELYAERRDELAAIVTREMGKPIFQAQIEVDIVASIYRYYADNGPEFLEDEELTLPPAARR